MKKNIFGTDGIRTTVGRTPLTPEELPVLGYAIGQWFQGIFKDKSSILIGSDTRESKDFIKTALASGLLHTGINIIDVGIIPTPGLYTVLKHTHHACALMISASHNPYSDNGIKIMTQQGKLSLDDEQTITQLFNTKISHPYIHFGSYTTSIYTDIYFNHLLHHFDHLNLTGKRIVLDCANGATYTIAPSILNKLGAQVIVMHNQPNGKNINDQCGAIYSSALQQAVLNHKADFGFSFDGDGDRVIACTHNGSIKNGDHILALLAQHTRYIQDTSIVGTVMSNMGLEVYLNSLGKTLIRTAVGDKHVAAELEKNALHIGGESSGHIILSDISISGDGIATALAVCEAAQHTHNWELNLFKEIPQIHTTLKVKNKKDLTASPLCDIIENYTQQLEHGRIVIRYSGTQPVLRIMIEEDNQEHAQLICTSLVNALKEAI